MKWKGFEIALLTSLEILAGFSSCGVLKETPWAVEVTVFTNLDEEGVKNLKDLPTLECL